MPPSPAFEAAFAAIDESVQRDSTARIGKLVADDRAFAAEAFRRLGIRGVVDAAHVRDSAGAVLADWRSRPIAAGVIPVVGALCVAELRKAASIRADREVAARNVGRTCKALAESLGGAVPQAFVDALRGAA